MTLICFSVACLNIQSSDILEYNRSSWNPSYDFNLESEYSSKLYVSLTKKINGYGGSVTDSETEGDEISPIESAALENLYKTKTKQFAAMLKLGYVW